jgi:predicted transcriptional regulator
MARQDAVGDTEDEATGSEIEMSEADREELRQAVLEGLELAKKYRGVPHEKVREWLLSLDTDNPLPRPRGEPI